MAVHSIPYKWTVRNLLMVVLMVMVMTIVESNAEKVNLSGQREREIELKLKQLNKQPLKTIESLDGEIIDCISITKQLAFDHPMLKNHTIQMKPSSYPHEVSTEFNASDQPEDIAQPWQLVGDCPENTIPIKRTTRENLLRVDSIENYGKKISHKNISQPHKTYHPNPIGHEYATAHVIENNGVFRGCKAEINLWKPKVESEELSISQIWVAGGKYDSTLNTIEAGWEVNHNLHGDYYLRFFIYWTSDGYQHKGCYNLLCSGFVQTNKRISLGARIKPTSSYNGQQYVVTLLIWKDPKTGNWWLKYNNEPLGYWPNELLPSLRDAANRVEWGGEIVHKKTNGQHTTTQMGSGHFPSEGFRKASYFRVLKIVDMSNGLRDPKGLQTSVSRPTCYNIKTGYSKPWEVFFYYGGPGRNPKCQ